MAADDELGVEETGGASIDGGPGLIYMPYVLMENLLDKLKLLNYDEVSPTVEDKISYHLGSLITLLGICKSLKNASAEQALLCSSDKSR